MTLSDVKAQLVDNAGRLQLALKARKHDDSVIKTLRTELEQALQQANSSRAREAHAMELVAQLRQEVKSLTKYAHHAFAEGRATAHGGDTQPPQRQQQQQSEDRAQRGGSARREREPPRQHSQERIALMPDFATWKKEKNHVHDHASLKAPLPSNSIPMRNIHLRSPMERAVQRGHTKLKFRK